VQLAIVLNQKRESSFLYLFLPKDAMTSNICPLYPSKLLEDQSAYGPYCWTALPNWASIDVCIPIPILEEIKSNQIVMASKAKLFD